MVNEVLAIRHRAGLTQRELAEAAGTSQPTIAAYERGRKSPTLTTLHRLAREAGLEMAVTYHSTMTREERRSLFLHHAIVRRLREDPDAVLARARRNLATMRRSSPGAEALLREWDVLLDRPLDGLLAQILDPGEHARELRHVTPFAGVLSASERAETYRAFREAEVGRR
jgi:transcriptional regulator with XRE-family HTH domain